MSSFNDDPLGQIENALAAVRCASEARAKLVFNLPQLLKQLLQQVVDRIIEIQGRARGIANRFEMTSGELETTSQSVPLALLKRGLELQFAICAASAQWEATEVACLMLAVAYPVSSEGVDNSCKLISTFRARKQAVTAIEQATPGVRFSSSSVSERRFQERLAFAREIGFAGLSQEPVASLGSPETGFGALCTVLSESCTDWTVVHGVFSTMLERLERLNAQLLKADVEPPSQADIDCAQIGLERFEHILKAATGFYSLARVASTSLKELGLTELAEAFEKLGGESPQASTTK